MKVRAKAGRGGKIMNNRIDPDSLQELLRDPQTWADLRENINNFEDKQAFIDHFNQLDEVSISGLGDVLLGEYVEFSAKFISLEDEEKDIYCNELLDHIIEVEEES